MDRRALMNCRPAPAGLAILLAALVGVAACGDASTEPEVSSVTVTPSLGLAVGIGDTVRFVARATVRSGEAGEPEWSTDDSGVATIDGAGLATAVAAGVTRVRAHFGGVTATAELEVYVAADLASHPSGQSYWGRKNYVQYLPGTLPLVLGAPHGGGRSPGEISDRTPPAILGGDMNTLELALAIRDALVDLTGFAPHVVISHLDRAKLDPNRDIGIAAQGDVFAEQAHREYHSLIEHGRSIVGTDFGGGLYLDIHGHSQPPPRLHLGYGISSSVLNQPDSALDDLGTRQMATIRDIGVRSSEPFSQVVRGATSLGGYLEASGVPVLPSPGDPRPGSDVYFCGCSGSAPPHGSMGDGEVVSEIGMEHYLIGLRDTDENRRAYAALLAVAIRSFMLEHYGYFEPTP